jgi:hypothetical protein
MESFRDCGFLAFLSLALGILATLIGVVALALALIKPRTGLIIGVLALASSLGAPGAGVLGMIWGRQKTEAAIAGPWIAPEQKERIRVEGYREAGLCVPVGATIGVLPLVMAAIAIAVGAVRPKSEKKD